MAKVKDFYATKSNREKIYKAINYSASISGYIEYENNFALGLGNKFVSMDTSIISECYGSNDVIFENLDNLLVVNTELKERLGSAQTKDEVFEILNEDMNFEETKSNLIKELEEKYKKLNITDKEYILEVKFNSNIIAKVVEIMDENNDSFHSYPSFKVDENNDIKIVFQTEIIDYNNKIEIINRDTKKFDIYFPFEFGKQYKKIDSLVYKLFHNNQKSNIAEVTFEYEKFRYRLLYSVLKER